MTIDSMESSRTRYFDYDDVGNRTNLTDIAGTTTNYTKAVYNAANRLTQSVAAAVPGGGGLTNTFVYDAANDIVSGLDIGQLVLELGSVAGVTHKGSDQDKNTPSTSLSSPRFAAQFYRATDR